ncbi:MAG: hypothetical protein IJP31_09705 [Lachnospiraceae bacterium]|nr:hypothetical protein [Lachnospiraceae bacterium]
MRKEMSFKGVNAEKPFAWEKLNEYGKIAYIGSWKDGFSDRRAYREIVDHPLYRHVMEFVDLYEEMDTIILEKYSAVVIPAMVDEVYLHRYVNKIRAYLDNGGAILSFMQNFTGILPNNTGYIASPLAIKDREVHFADTQSSTYIFDGIREYDVNFRRGVKGFFNRGYFELDSFAQEEKPELLLVDNEGKCVAYVDRSSTNGIILAAAASDLLGYGLFDNTTARRMGVNLLEWLTEELQKKDYHTLRKERKFVNDEMNTEVVFDYGSSETGRDGLKNAVITGGMAFHQKFFRNKNGKYADFYNKRVYAADMGDFRFADYDYVVLASNLNAKFLLPYKEEILEYLENGGHIVSLGDSMKEYLPNIRWQSYPTNFWWWRMEGADMPLYAVESNDGGKTFVKQPERTKEGLFSKIDVRVAKWHCHGAFYPPAESESILVNELDEAIIYKDLSFKGNLYVMSLDPDYHFGQGFMPTTEPFFDALMEWIEEDIQAGRRS